jgi:hypothetical protein
MEAWAMATAATTTTLSDAAFLAMLAEHPDLRERIVSIVLAVANADGDLKEADVFEERLIAEMQVLGQAALQGWADKQVEVTEQEIRQQPGMHRQGKKKSPGIRHVASSPF